MEVTAAFPVSCWSNHPLLPHAYLLPLLADPCILNEHLCNQTTVIIPVWCSTKWAKKPQNGSQGMHYSCSFSHFPTASYVLWHLGWHRLLSFDSVQSCHIHFRVCHFSCWEWASLRVCIIYTEQTQYMIVFLYFHIIVRIVSTYLVHHGYCATAEAFAKSTGQSFTEELASIKNRQSEPTVMQDRPLKYACWIVATSKFELISISKL